jgi:hypothetical protein
MARPSPVPPYLRVVVAVGLAELLEQARQARFAEADAGVAHRRSAGPTPPACSASRRTVSTTSPRSVNFTALLSRFSSTWRSRVTSPLMGRRQSALEDVGDVQVLLGRAGPIRSIADSTHSRRSKGCASMSMRPASIFEKSRMSLMIVSSSSPESRIVDAKSRWSA